MKLTAPRFQTGGKTSEILGFPSGGYLRSQISIEVEEEESMETIETETNRDTEREGKTDI